MPSAPLHYCGPSCNTLVAKGRCKAHSQSGWRQGVERPRGWKLQQLRKKLYAEEPYCRACQRLLLDNWIRDHIVPLAEGGTDAPDNIQPLCKSCSDVKTQAEAKRGTQRGR